MEGSCYVLSRAGPRQPGYCTGPRWGEVVGVYLVHSQRTCRFMLPTTTFLVEKHWAVLRIQQAPCGPMACVSQASTSDQPGRDRPRCWAVSCSRGSGITSQSQQKSKSGCPGHPLHCPKEAMGASEGMGLQRGDPGYEFRSESRASARCPSAEGEDTTTGELVFSEQVGLCCAVGERAAQHVQPSAQGHQLCGPWRACVQNQAQLKDRLMRSEDRQCGVSSWRERSEHGWD